MKVMLTQPNFSWLGKRTWKLLPYSLGLLNASLLYAGHDSWIFDPNFDNLTEGEIRTRLAETKPEVVGISTCSSEYDREVLHLSGVIRAALPEAIIVLGGILPTADLDLAMENPFVDYFMVGEGEHQLPQLLETRLVQGSGEVLRPREFIGDLDSLDFPDYRGLNLSKYLMHTQRYAHLLLPRQFPFALTVTSRGCPYDCSFCSSSHISGKKVRIRSISNVLEEIDVLQEDYGIKEIIFLDDALLFNHKRAIALAEGLKERDITWKSVNLNAWHLDRELLRLMWDSGCYQLNLSIESGSQRVLSNVVGKPFKLVELFPILATAKDIGFEVTSNFVIGLPGETWEELRETFRFAEYIDIDECKFHIATPLPNTEMMRICNEKGYLRVTSGEEMSGFTQCSIETLDFTATELQILRAFEWDRINFSSDAKKEKIAQMEGISMEELEQWRVNTRRDLGVLLPGSKTID
jgi:radical SAM superfamily enzyme YgiQ (UPF0313 family)